MTVYGFNDRETAIKLKKMVEAGSVTSASIAPNGFDEQGGFAFQNNTGKTIPPFGLVFVKRFNYQGQGTADYPAVAAFSYSQVKDHDDFDSWVKDAWAFNNSMPVEPNQYGWAQSKDTFVIGFDKASGLIDAGTQFSAHHTNDFEILQFGKEEGPKWKGYQRLPAAEMGATENERLIQLFVPYGRESREVDLVRAVRISETQHRINEPGPYFDEVVIALNAGNYPSAIGAKAFLINPGVPVAVPGGGFGGGTTIRNWWILEEQYLEAENPNSGGGGGTGPGTP